jgi:putative ABC transport system permease protein
MKRIALPASSGSTRSALNDRVSGNAGMIFIKCKSGASMAGLSHAIDELHRNSDYPTRTETEEVFGKMFTDMLGDPKGMFQWVSLAMLFTVLCITGNSMAMSMSERTTEEAVLTAIGFDRGRVLLLVMTEAVLLAGLGGVLGSIGCKGLCEIVDVSRYGAGFLPFFYIPWQIVFQGLGVSLLTGFLSGIYPAVRGEFTGHRRPEAGYLI